MKTYKKETRTFSVIDKAVCDWCKEEIKDFTEDIYDPHSYPREIKMSEEWQSWNDSRTPWSINVDLCVPCMLKFIQNMIDIGIDVGKDITKNTLYYTKQHIGLEPYDDNNN